LDRLLEELSSSEIVFEFNHLVIVNDGSTTPTPISLLKKLEIQDFSVTLVELNRNMGHQFALASGLKTLLDVGWAGLVVTMDSDGEDSPFEIQQMCEANRLNPEALILAKRGHRKDSRIFKLSYRMYRAIFRILTGKTIDFGNFMLIPNQHLKHIVYRDEFWNHLSASVLKSECDKIKIRINRRSRFNGSSKMNFISLVNHALASMAVFAETIFIRMFYFTFLLLTLVLLTFGLIIFLKLNSAQFVPGWTSSILGILAILAVQAVGILSSTIFLSILFKRNIHSPTHSISPQYIARILQFSE